MSEVLEEIISLIKKGSNNNEICKKTNITKRELYNYLTILSNLGYQFKRSYYVDGSIIYELDKSLTQDSGVVELETRKYESSFNLLLTSDWHIDNRYTRKDLIQRMGEYCEDNKIHIILNTGDLISGTYGKGYKNSSILTQVKEFSKVYNTHNNMLMFGVLGDHDVSGINSEGVSIKRYLDNYRHDIVTNYNNLYIKLKKDMICLNHHLPKGERNQKNTNICFLGHSHKYTSSTNSDGILEVHVPALCDLAIPIPSILEATIEFNGDYISNLCIKQIIFDKEPEIISEITHSLIRKRY